MNKYKYYFLTFLLFIISVSIFFSQTGFKTYIKTSSTCPNNFYIPSIKNTFPKNVNTDSLEKKNKNIENEDTLKDKIYNLFDVDKAPVARNLDKVQKFLRYPEIARTSGIEGIIIVQILVGIDGNVEKVGRIIGEEVFYDEVKSKVVYLTFEPATLNGKPVRCWLKIPLKFLLKNKPENIDSLKSNENE